MYGCLCVLTTRPPPALVESIHYETQMNTADDLWNIVSVSGDERSGFTCVQLRMNGGQNDKSDFQLFFKQEHILV